MVYITHGRRERIEGYFERYVKDLLNRAFTNADFFALSETAKYKPSEDESIWMQNTGRKAEVVEVYSKGEWICDVYSGMTRDEIVNKVWKLLNYKRLEKERQIKEGEKNDNPTNPTA